MFLRRTLLGAVAAAPAFSACTYLPAVGGALPDPMAPLPHDTSSYANPDEARVRHVSLDLTCDFTTKKMIGTAKLDIVTAPGAQKIVLDWHSLDIKSVKTPSGADLQYAIGAPATDDADKGAPMTITLAEGVRQIVIAYETSPEAGALQWLEGANTSSGKPYLFSQGESIYTRTWVPTQDSPGIRQTYDARIVVPEGLNAIMSAERLTPRGQAVAGGRAFRFRMTHPIPCYLFAIAVGDIQFRSVGPRTGVYSEPSMVDAAAAEFSDMERMLHAAETLYGPYRWGRYDVLVLPPSFPYGGMENPTLTFATPTLIAGDKSLVNVITHELAHSWSGNLVTNGVWTDSWLNEGFTNYIEGRVTEVLYGPELAQMANALAWADIQTAMRTLTPPATQLHQPESIGPEASSSAINYDKGALFLRTIEAAIGRPKMDAYLRSYFDRYAFQPMTTQKFLADFREQVVKGDVALEASLQLDKWAYEPGLPSNAQEPHAAAFDRVAEVVNAFNAGGAASAVPWANWGTFERQRFLQTLPRVMPKARLDELEAALRLNETHNGEVLFDWIAIAVRSHYDAAVPAIEGFLMRQGRRKYVQPIYRNLMREGAWGQPIARRIYAQARPTYFPVTAQGIDRYVTPG